MSFPALGAGYMDLFQILICSFSLLASEVIGRVFTSNLIYDTQFKATLLFLAGQLLNFEFINYAGYTTFNPQLYYENSGTFIMFIN